VRLFLSGFLNLGFCSLHPCCSMYQYIIHSFFFFLLNSVSLYGYTTFCLSVNGYLGYFHFGAIMNNAVMNIHVQVYIGKPIFNYL